MLNRTMRVTMVALSTSLLFTLPQVTAQTPLIANNIERDSIQLDFNLQLDNGVLVHPIETAYKQKVEENERIKAEQLRQEQLRQEQLKKEQEEARRRQHERTFVVTYYGATYKECGNNHFITASGVPVQEGHIAAPKEIPFGSKVILNGVEYVVADRGNPDYIKILNDGSIKVDVFVPRLPGESTYDYEQRIMELGIHKEVGQLYINNN